MKKIIKIKFSTKTVEITKLITDQYYNPFKSKKKAQKDFYSSEMKYMGLINHIVARKALEGDNYIVIINSEQVEAARRNGIKHLEVLVPEGENRDDDIRIYAYGSFFKEMDNLSKYQFLKNLREWITNKPSGQKLAKEIKKKYRVTRVREILSIISGISDAYVNMLLSIGDYDVDAFSLIESRESTIREEYLNSISCERIKAKKSGSTIIPVLETEFIEPEKIKSLKSPYFQFGKSIVINSDCIGMEGMRLLNDESIGAIFGDLPSEATNKSWDSIIPFEDLWKEYLRVIKPGGAIVLFGTQPFTTKLISSKIEFLKECLVWDKVSISNPQLAKIQHLKHHEDICVFGKGKINYYPQGLVRIVDTKQKRFASGVSNSEQLGHIKRRTDYLQEYTNYPKSILKYSRPSNPIHPTQKPVELMEYLIKTYSLEGETILDATLGSGTICIAAINTNRNCVGFEKELKYFNKIKNRITDLNPKWSDTSEKEAILRDLFEPSEKAA